MRKCNKNLRVTQGVDSTVSIVVSNHILRDYHAPFFGCPQPDYIHMTVHFIERFRSNMRQYMGVGVTSLISWAGLSKRWRTDVNKSVQDCHFWIPAIEKFLIWIGEPFSHTLSVVDCILVLIITYSINNNRKPSCSRALSQLLSIDFLKWLWTSFSLRLPD